MVAAAPPAPPRLVEVFRSIQGEGTHVGEPTLFVRFGECDLRCRWCDSVETWSVPDTCRIEQEPGSARFETVPNPVPWETVDRFLAAGDLAGGTWLSATGGEPLLQPAAVAELVRRGRALGARIHLETHGLHAGALAEVGPGLAAIAMDWKLASDVRRARAARGTAADFDAEHEAFLAVARDVADLSVKIVVTPASGDDEIERAARAIGRAAPGATLVLQPVTPCGPVKERPTALRLIGLQRACHRFVSDVRVIPQTHPLYGAL